jgi:hypothetical protein
MAQFLLLLHGDPTRFQSMPQDQQQAAFGEYMGWSRSKDKAAYVLGSNKLFDEPGKVLRGTKPVITDGPYGETKEWLGGYYLIEATNYDEALKRVADHPHLKYDGTLVLRQVEPLPK